MEWETFVSLGNERRLRREVDRHMRALKIDLAFLLGGLFLFMTVVILATWGVMS